MSFLSGLKKVGSWVTGGSFSANLAKTAIIGYTIYRLNRNLNKSNSPENIDEGIRLQINPSAENRIPVVYGSAFLNGIISDAEMTGDNKTMFFCITIAEKTGLVRSSQTASTTTFREVYWNDQRITFKADGVTVDFTQDRQGIIDRSLDDRVQIFCYDGSSSNQVSVDNFSLASSVNAASLIPSWDPLTHNMDELVFAVVRVDYDRERGVTNLGNVQFHIENSMTKPGDCLFDYFTNSRYGAGIPTVEVDQNSLAALDTFSDTPVTYEDQELGANQVLAHRYRINGIIDTEASVLQNMELLASSAGSWISYDVQQGSWKIIINREDTSKASFDDNTIIGSLSITGTGIEDLYNRVRVEFPNRDIRDNSDFITVELPPQDLNDNEYQNTLNIAYNTINEPVQAEILGFIELKQSRVDLVVRFTTDYSFINLTAGDVVAVTNTRLSWTNKLFRIVSINQTQDDTGQLLCDITALEYDAGVYSLIDLFRFTRTDQNGIITIGSIGIPGTPIVTKIEEDSRPRIIVNSTSPTGIVERMEFWRTTDVNVQESLRSYSLIGTITPVDGGTFGISQFVTFEFDNQGAGNFLIKTRGLNSITVGPFSVPSGIVEFAPRQTPDRIGPNTALTGVIGALGALQLLSLVDRLMKNEAGEGGLFDKIFGIFKNETGVDIVGQAAEGELVVASEIGISSDGTLVTPTVSNINFEGGIDVTAVGNEVTVSVSGTGADLPPGANNKDILAWNAAAGEWQIISGCITCDFPPPPPPPPPPPVPCRLTITQTLPPNSYNFPPLNQPVTPVPNTGSYFVSFSISPGSGPNIPLRTPLEKGTGNAELYSTDGILVQILPASQIIIRNNVVELPFNPRVPGKDYYILLDEGLVKYCDCESVAIDTPTGWTFTTSTISRDPYPASQVDALDPLTAPSVSFPLTLRVTTVIPSGANRCANTTNSLTVFFSEAIKPGSGLLEVRDRFTGAQVSTFSPAAGTITGSGVLFSNLVGLTPNTQYDIVIPAGFMLTNRQPTTFSQPGCEGSPITVTVPAGPELASEPATRGFSTSAQLEVLSFAVARDPAVGGVRRNSNLTVQFNKPIQANPAGSKVTIFSGNGAPHQTFDLNATFDDDRVAQIVSLSGSVLVLNPTRLYQPSTEYYLLIDSDALIDSQCQVPFPGVSDTNLIRWRTSGLDTVQPQSPTFGSLYIDFEFDRPIKPGRGKINIIDSDVGGLYTQLRSNDPAIEYSDVPFVNILNARAGVQSIFSKLIQSFIIRSAFANVQSVFATGVTAYDFTKLEQLNLVAMFVKQILFRRLRSTNSFQAASFSQSASLSEFKTQLFSFGSNGFGRTGLGTTTGNTLTPTQVGIAKNWNYLSAGRNHSLAITIQGQIWAWGLNSFGQTGLGIDTGNTLTPTQVGTASNWATVSAGGAYSLAVTTTGELWVWGPTQLSQIGFISTPTRVGSASNWASVSVGESNHSFAITTTGELWSWGLNSRGQLGLGDTSDRTSLTQVGTATNWAYVSAGLSYSLAITTTGELWSWGRNLSGRTGLGIDTDTNTLTPTRVGTASNWAYVSAGDLHSLALTTTGELWSWGFNGFGATGLGTTTGNTLVPTRIGSASNWAYVSAHREHSLAVTTTGELWSWGRNENGKTGLGTTTGITQTPTRVGSATNWGQPSAGQNHSIILRIN